MKLLKQIMEKWQQNHDIGHGDKNTIHSYGDIYEYLLYPYRKNSNVLEIGLAFGESLEVWHEYFIDSKIFGIDINDKEIKKYLSDDRFSIYIDDATQEKCLEKFHDIQFDVIIDDASHNINDQVKTYNLFKKNLKKDGIYIIEDIDNIQNNYNIFKNLDNEKNISIIDLRFNKYRYDDILVIIKHK